MVNPVVANPVGVVVMSGLEEMGVVTVIIGLEARDNMYAFAINAVLGSVVIGMGSELIILVLEGMGVVVNVEAMLATVGGCADIQGMVK